MRLARIMASAAYLAALAACEPHWPAKAYDPELRYNSRWVVLGQTDSGKTRHVVLALEKTQRAVVFDPARDPKWLAVGFEPTTTARLVLEPDRLARPQPARFVVHPEPEDWRRDDGQRRPAEEWALELDAFAQVCRLAGNLVAVFDECGDYERPAGPTLAEVACRDRHEGIAAIYLAQRAVQIPLTVRAQATDVFSAFQQHPDDLAALEEWCGPAFRAEVSAWQAPSPLVHSCRRPPRKKGS